MIYPNKPLYLLSLLGYIYYLTYYTLTTKDNIVHTSVKKDQSISTLVFDYTLIYLYTQFKNILILFEYLNSL